MTESAPISDLYHFDCPSCGLDFASHTFKSRPPATTCPRCHKCLEWDEFTQKTWVREIGNPFLPDNTVWRREYYPEKLPTVTISLDKPEST